jgi:hypothetical protein
VYTLTVIVDEGVIGAPAAGNYTYSKDEIISYSYSETIGYDNPVVTLDGSPLPESGTITITGDHTLSVVSDPYDIRGEWNGEIFAPGEGTYDWDATFNGNLSSGTASCYIDAIGMRSETPTGDYKVNGNEVDFTLVFSFAVLTCSGTFENANLMKGSWEWAEGGIVTQTGTWDLSK